MSFLSARKFSRQGKVHDHANKIFTFREKNEQSALKRISADDVEKELKKVQREINSLNKIEKVKNKQSSSFLSPSREKIEQINKPTNLEAPPSTRYNPRINFIIPRSPGVLLRSVSSVSRKSKVYIPTCMDTDDLTCHYPVKSQQALEAEASYVDLDVLNEKVKQKRTDDLLNLSWSPVPSVSFDKQSPRKYNLTPQCDARFESINYFPQIFSKYKSTPCVDFNKISPRKEPYRSLSPPPYNWSDKIIKKKLDTGAVDMSKGANRFPEERYTTDTVNRQKAMDAYNMILPKTHTPTPNFEKVTSRKRNLPKIKEDYRKHIHDFL
ncbi:unnamed protein product [Blepharisma stoltei]|uniref:Uncharacterized protein n=1 Tax=Blepharisma stoltei TaxID=1481888 RepID=A0AAU9JWT2_9CILI|nr:unnamed protein product [Blepharisma stoltei]